MMRESSVTSQERQSIRKTKSYLEIRTANVVVRSTKDAKVYFQELGTYSYVKLVEDSPSALSLGRF